MTKVEKQRQRNALYEKHMMSGGVHPNSFTLLQMEQRLFSGVALTNEHLAKAYREIFNYLAQDTTRIHRSLRTLKLSERFAADGSVVEAWMTLESDGTIPHIPFGTRYTLTLQEVKNLWLLVYPYNK